jgi:hypothetical protein
MHASKEWACSLHSEICVGHMVFCTFSKHDVCIEGTDVKEVEVSLLEPYMCISHYGKSAGT